MQSSQSKLTSTLGDGQLSRGTFFLSAVVAVFVTGAIGCDSGSPPFPMLPEPEAAPRTVSDDTSVTVVSLRPLVIDFVNESGAGRIGAPDATGTSPDDCEAFTLGIRPRTDDGGRYHDVEDPAEDIEWLYAAAVDAVAPDADAPSGTQRLELEFVSAASSREVSATVTIAPAAEGFVAIDAVFDVAEGDVAMLQSCMALPTGLDAGTVHVVGGGERFDGVDLMGRVIPLAFRAPAPFTSGTNESHAPIPFVATNTGAALLVETERVGAFDVGATNPAALLARFHGTTLPLRVRAAPRVGHEGAPSRGHLAHSPIVNNVAAHNRLMGLPPPPPLWALAPQQWRNEHDVTVEDGRVIESGRDRLMADIDKMRSVQIPGALVWIDAPWSTGFNSFEFNEDQFPNPRTLFDDVEAKGYRVIVWATEHINRSDDSGTLFGMPPFATLDDFNRFADLGYFVKNTDGTPFTLSWGRGSGGFVDFTHPPAVEAWKERMRPLLELGVRGFKLDYGESMRADLLGLGPNDAVTFADGSTTRVQHTRYQRLYHEAFLAALDDVWGEDRFIITRTGGIYDQRNGVTLWPGDLDNDFSLGGVADADGNKSVGGLRAAISGGLSAAMSGYPFYGSDIGGYRGGPPTTEVLIRWAQFGALSPVMQLGGGGTGDQTHNPWDEALYDAERALPAYTKVARLHMDLLPYLAAVVDAASTSGMPPMVPVGVVADSDATWSDIDTYYFGDALLVAPVVTAGATERTVPFPPGDWLDFVSGAAYGDEETVAVAAPFDHLPLFIRAGAIVPLLDPRVDTVIDADDDGDIVDVNDVAPVTLVRTSAGPAAVFTTVEGALLSQESDDDTVTVSIDSPTSQRWVVQVWLRDRTGPDASAPINGHAVGDNAVETFDELLTCALPCTFRDDVRLAVAVDAAASTVVFGAP